MDLQAGEGGFRNPTTFLSFPAELRDLVYTELLTPRQFRSRQPLYQSTHDRRPPPSDSYFDSSIFFHSFPPRALLHINRQIRDEVVSHASRTYTPNRGVLITIDICWLVRGSYCTYIPTQTRFSPLFDSLLPILKCIKAVELCITPGWTWWNGEKPLAVNNALTTLSGQLDNLESLEVVIFISSVDFWNWDLPEQRHEKVGAFLEWWPVGTRMRRCVKSLKRRTEGSDAEAEFYRADGYVKGGEIGSEIWEASIVVGINEADHGALEEEPLA